MLENHEDSEVRRQACLLRWQCTRSITELARPIDLPASAPELPALTPLLVPIDVDVHGAEDEVLDEAPLYYPCSWWRLFLSRPHWHEGIRSALLRPGRRLILKRLFWNTSECNISMFWLILFFSALMLFCSGYLGLPMFPLLVALFSPVGFLVVFCFIYCCWYSPYCLSGLALIVRRLDQYWLFSSGRPARGQVAWVTEHKNGNFNVGVKFNVADINGRVSRVVTDVTLYREELSPGLLKEELDVLYHPVNTSNIVLVDFGQYVVAPDVPLDVVSQSEEIDLWWREFLGDALLTAGIERKLLRPFRGELRAKHSYEYQGALVAAFTNAILLPICFGPEALFVVGLLVAWAVGQVSCI